MNDNNIVASNAVVETRVASKLHQQKTQEMKTRQLNKFGTELLRIRSMNSAETKAQSDDEDDEVDNGHSEGAPRKRKRQAFQRDKNRAIRQAYALNTMSYTIELQVTCLSDPTINYFLSLKPSVTACQISSLLLKLTTSDSIQLFHNGRPLRDANETIGDVYKGVLDSTIFTSVTSALVPLVLTFCK